MTRRQFLTSTALAGAASLTGCQGPNSRPNILVGDADGLDPKPVYELRVYTIAPGKREALLQRFTQYTTRFFERYKIFEEGYWMPINPDDNRLFFLLRYPNEHSRNAAWEDFANDPVWQVVHAESTADGPLVTEVESHLLSRTNYSRWQVAKEKVSQTKTSRMRPPFSAPHEGVFELRTYTTPPGMLPHLDARFRDHTCRLFEKHGMKNWLYFHRLPGQQGAGTTLQYFLVHDSVEQARQSFDWFRQDPDWVAAREASEAAAGGSLTVPNGVQSVFLKAMPFSYTQ